MLVLLMSILALWLRHHRWPCAGMAVACPIALSLAVAVIVTLAVPQALVVASLLQGRRVDHVPLTTTRITSYAAARAMALL